jgi:hypothetical protein
MKAILRIFAVFLLASCSHLKIDNVNNEIVDSIQSASNQKYFIPIPKDYCRYNKTNKDEKPYFAFWEDSQDYDPKEHPRKIVAVYENCEEKRKIQKDEIIDASRSLIITEAMNYKINQSTRSEIIDFTYKNNIKRRETLLKSPITNFDQYAITEESLKKYGFSPKRREMLIELYKGFADYRYGFKVQNIKDENANYFLIFTRSKDVGVYSVESYTKIYDKPVIITIVRNFRNHPEYDSSIANQVLEESKNYVKKFSEVNDKNDFREFSFEEKKIKFFIPKNFVADPNEKETLQNFSSSSKSFDPKAVVLKASSDGTVYFLFFSFPKNMNSNIEKIASREEFLDYLFFNLKNSKNDSDSFFSKEKNGIFVALKVGNDTYTNVFSTFINKVPVTLIVTVVNKNKKIQNDTLNNLKKDMVEYVDFLDKNN